MNHVTFPPRTPHPSQIPSENSQLRPRKLRRISRACDFCHKRSIRCKPSAEESTRCQNCLDFEVSCTYNRPAKKRGIKSGNSKQSNGSQNEGSSRDGERDGERDARMLLELTNCIHGNGSFNIVDELTIPEKWRTMVLANEGKIRDLVDVYYEVIYPIFPLFHSPTLLRKTASRDYLIDPSFFVDTMAICALSSARARAGAFFPGRWNPDHFQDPSSEMFFAAAKEALPQDLSAMKGLDWMRTCGLIALYGIQVGRIEIMHQYLGLYHSLVAMDGLHDERNWPKSIGLVEMELRRRLFWSMYTLEVYSSIACGGVIRCRESQSLVSYPSEVDDEFFSESGYNPPNSLMSSFPSQAITNPISWLHGWNFTTELYRVLEHAMDNFHQKRPRNNGPCSPCDLFRRDTPHQSVILDNVMVLFEQLPARFKETKLIPQNGTGGLEDKFSFQAANITATLQMVRMALFPADEATVDQKCAIARDLLDSFGRVPVFFLRAVSSPLLHHLAGIVSILATVIEGPISESSYLQLREVLLAMADLLSSLEVGITRNVGAAAHLRHQITNIDEYMAAQRQADFPFTSTSPNHNTFPHHLSHPPPQTQTSANHILPATPNSSINDANIDPSLQDTGPATVTGRYNVNSQQQAARVYEYAESEHSKVVGEGMNGAGQIDEQFQFQIPPDLLEGWPWPFKLGQDFGRGGFESRETMHLMK